MNLKKQAKGRVGPLFIGPDKTAMAWVHEGHLAERMVTFRSKKIDDNSYEVVFSDKQTGKVVQTFRYTVIGNELTLNWFNGDDQRPAITLMYDKQ